MVLLVFPVRSVPLVGVATRLHPVPLQFLVAMPVAVCAPTTMGGGSGGSLGGASGGAVLVGRVAVLARVPAALARVQFVKEPFHQLELPRTGPIDQASRAHGPKLRDLGLDELDLLGRERPRRAGEDGSDLSHERPGQRSSRLRPGSVQRRPGQRGRRAYSWGHRGRDRRGSSQTLS